MQTRRVPSLLKSTTSSLSTSLDALEQTRCTTVQYGHNKEHSSATTHQPPLHPLMEAGTRGVPSLLKSNTISLHSVSCRWFSSHHSPVHTPLFSNTAWALSKLCVLQGYSETFQQWYDAHYDTWLAIWYKNNMGSFRALQYSATQWLEIDTMTF